jgi:hypothetical protein
MVFRGPFFLLMLFVCGCAANSPSQKNLYQEGYRAAVKDEIKSIGAQFQGGHFPYYHWSAPIVQDVLVPAHIGNGVFIPEHKELVIIKPGEWAKTQGFPIATSKEGYEGNTNDRPMDSADITHLPNSGSSTDDDGAGKGTGAQSGMDKQ